MPTSVGPNTYGEENLVFGYDLGDVQNSYKGEPAFNRATSLGNWSAARSSLTLTTEVEPPIKGAPVYILERTATNAGVLCRDANSGFGYTNNSDLGTVGDGTWKYSIWVKGHPSGDSSTSFSIDVGDRNGVSRTVTPTTEWTKLETDDSAGLNNGAYKFFDFNIDGALNNKVYVSAVIITTGNQSHPQWLPEKTTRSVSGSLIDLTGNSTIDLTNVSFDSNAHVDYDGSNDYVSLGNPVVLRDLTTGTIEAVYKRDASTGTYQMIFTDAGSDLEITYSGNVLQFYIGNSGLSYTHAVTGQYFHVVGTWGSGFKRLYLNGVEVTSGTNTGVDTGNRDRYVGGRGTSFPFNGKIPMIKVLTRALTASEIKANYNAVKGRFNI